MVPAVLQVWGMGQVGAYGGAHGGVCSRPNAVSRSLVNVSAAMNTPTTHTGMNTHTHTHTRARARAQFVSSRYIMGSPL